MDSATRSPVDADELTDALRRVSADPVFVRSPQLRRLLDYLVKGAIAGECQPKEYTIAIEALGRSADFDPDHDAIVRVQAGRLRRALEKYYATAGKEDAVRIVLATGSYAAFGERRETVTEAGAPPALSRRLRAVMFAGIAAMVAVAVLLPLLRGPRASAPPSTDEQVLAPATNGLPTVVILPFDGPGVDADVPALIGLRREIASAFSRFEAVNVVQIPRGAATPRLPGGARIYRLSTMVTLQKGGVGILFQLTDQADGTIVWTRDFHVPGRGDGEAQQKQIVRTLASTLLQPFGVVASRERAHQLRTDSGDPGYRCVLQAADAMRDAANDGYVRARACLVGVTKSDPNNVLAHTYLASILNRIFQFGHSPEVDILDQALAAARRAVHINPASARAHFALYLTRFNMRDFDAADAAMARSRELNDDDLVARSVYGGRLITRGRVDEGMAILDEVGYAFTARYCAHGFYAFLGHYLNGNMREADRHALELTCPSYPVAFVAKALAAHDAGKPEIARRAIDSLAELFPAWRDDPRVALGRTIPDAAIVERILRDLATAGLIASVQN